MALAMGYGFFFTFPVLRKESLSTLGHLKLIRSEEQRGWSRKDCCFKSSLESEALDALALSVWFR
jgi:hypothetical protein